MFRLLTAAACAVLAGCQNPCQDLCNDMANFARTECDIDVPDAQVDACIDAQDATDDRDALRVCRQFDSSRDIEEEWGCEELERYFTEL